MVYYTVRNSPRRTAGPTEKECGNIVRNKPSGITIIFLLLVLVALDTEKLRLSAVTEKLRLSAVTERKSPWP